MGGEREEIDGREGRGKNGKKVGEEREGERGREGGKREREKKRERVQTDSTHQHKRKH